MGSILPVTTLPLDRKLAIVVERAAGKLPGEVGRQLLAMVTPGAIAVMAVTLGIWAGSHFFGVGEIADICLLIVGYVMVGGVALEAAKEIWGMVDKTVNAKVDRDLSEAGDHLAKAITLLGIQVVLALLLRKKPEGTLSKTELPPRMPPLPSYAKAFPKPLPRGEGAFYKPKVKFTDRKFIGEGGTKPTGDTNIGRFKANSEMPMKTARQELRHTAYHEAVHRFLAPKLYVFREIRIYAAQSAYRKSYILRYLEEAFAETYANFKTHGVTAEQLFNGASFPITGPYAITLAKIGVEAKGLLLGPITVGGMIFNVYYGLDDH